MHIQRNISTVTVFFKYKTSLYNMNNIKLHKTSKCLWTVHIVMYVVKWMGVFFFNVFINHFPKIHRSVLCKIAIDPLYFWDIYDINLWEKNYSRSTTYKAKAVFPIPYFEAEAVIGRCFSKMFCNVAFLHLSKPGKMFVTDFILAYLSVPTACYFTKG